MNCTECKKLLVPRIEELLRAEVAQAVDTHLHECRSCREEISQMMHLHNRLTVDGKSYTVSDFENRVFDRIFQGQAVEPRKDEELSNFDDLPDFDQLPDIDELSEIDDLPSINQPQVCCTRSLIWVYWLLSRIQVKNFFGVYNE